MRTVQFGISLAPNIADMSKLRELARLADTLGLDLLGIQDHPYVSRFFDTMSLISVLLAETRRLRIFPNVASLPLRPPALLAKSAASLDMLSGGRFELGIGSGASWEPIVAMGGQRRTSGEAIQALEEGIAIMRAIWNGQGSLRYDGKYYSLRGLQPGPRPTHTMGIWVGAVGEQMLHLTGRLADGWAAPIVSYLPYERWAWAQETIDHGAHQAGRDPSSILRVANLVGSITNRRGNGQPRGNTPLEGKSAYWIEVLTSLAIATRFDAFIFWPEVSSSEQIERFAHEVAPGVREAVARE
jgi:alkanesulfonate monooxygenase SsuD/methylene tetrahydromethanopterin reductase-like flavin-dependent oxidoreductase (luciferase family)